MNNSLAWSLPRLLIAVPIVLGYMWLLWWVIDRITRFDDHNELFEKGNGAYALQRVGLLAAQLIGMMAVLPDSDPEHPWWSAFWLLLEGGWVFVAILLTRFVVDWVLLPKIPNTDLLVQGNTAIGIVECGFYVGLGWLLNGSLTGTASSNWLAFASTVVFYMLGLALVMAVYWLYELVTPFDMRRRLQSGDNAAAFELAGLLMGTSIVTRVGVAGDFTDWASGIKGFFIVALISIVMLLIIRWVVGRLVVRASVRSVQEGGHTVAAAIHTTLMIASAIVVAAVVQGSLSYINSLS